MTPGRRAPFPVELRRALQHGLRRLATAKALSFSLTVGGWALMWAQALDLVGPLPLWLPLGLFMTGLASITAVVGRPKSGRQGLR